MLNINKMLQKKPELRSQANCKSLYEVTGHELKSRQGMPRSSHQASRFNTTRIKTLPGRPARPSGQRYTAFKPKAEQPAESTSHGRDEPLSMTSTFVLQKTGQMQSQMTTKSQFGVGSSVPWKTHGHLEKLAD